MKNRKYSIICGFMTGVMLLSGSAGCGEASAREADTEEVILREKASAANTFAYEEEGEEVPVSCTVTGTVTSMDGNAIQLEVRDSPGEKPMEEMAKDGGSMKPEEGEPKDGSGEKPEEGEPKDGGSEKPKEMPKDNMPERPEGTLGNLPGGKKAVLTLRDDSVVTGEIEQGRGLSVTFDENGIITAIEVSEGMGGGMAPGRELAGVDSYDAVTEYSEDTRISSENYTSSGTDENAVLVTEGANVTLDAVTVERTSEDSTGGDTASFYGVGAALLATDGEVNMSDSSITTDAPGGTGIFAYGEGNVHVSNTKIDTVQDTSGGIHVAGGGKLYADNLEVTTQGNSSAAIRSDRGGGIMVVNGGSFKSSGTGSPAVYCTADIAVNNANLTAEGSEAVCMEGLNNLHFYNCNITGDMKDDEQNDTTWTMIVYQSMSGDSQVGNATMQIQGGNIFSKNGGLLYTTNTQSNILLSDVDITYAEDSEFFLQCTGNNNQRGWGTPGENGADCTFTALDQEMEGNVIWDSVSKLKFYMNQESTLTGAILQDETWAGSGGDGFAQLYIGEDSTWVVTGDSTLTSLCNAGTIKDEDEKTVTVKGTDGTVYAQGDSQYTITVDSYSQTADFAGAADRTEWSRFTE